jgi:hypothetical protein
LAPDGLFSYKKMLILENFWRRLDWKYWLFHYLQHGWILRPFGIFTTILVYFFSFWYIYLILVYFSHFGIFFSFWYIFPILVCCTKNNLATLAPSLYVTHGRRIGSQVRLNANHQIVRKCSFTLLCISHNLTPQNSRPPDFDGTLNIQNCSAKKSWILENFPISHERYDYLGCIEADTNFSTNFFAKY